jgi:hypothetical protein
MMKSKKAARRMILFYTFLNGDTIIRDLRGNAEKYTGCNLTYCVLDFKNLYGYKIPADLIRY